MKEKENDPPINTKRPLSSTITTARKPILKNRIVNEALPTQPESLS